MSKYILSEENIIQIVDKKTETKNIDFKEDLNWDRSSKVDKIGVIKDILAMSNAQDGGMILFGIRDNDFEFIGLPKDSYLSFDQTKVNDLLQEYADPKLSCQVYKKNIKGKNLVIITVPEFTEIPIICKKDFHFGNKQILQTGQIYIRTKKASSEIIPTSHEMRDLVNRATIKRGDELLNSIKVLIKGKPIEKISKKSFEIYNKEIKEGCHFLKKNIGSELNNYGYWEVISYPDTYNPERIKELKNIDDLIKNCEVNLLGWNFPHTDRGKNASNFLNGRQSYTIWKEFVEGYRAYKSGLFLWQRAFVEDTKGYNINNKLVLDFIRTIRYITEFFIFFKRYYLEILKDDNLHVKISLNNICDRQIATLEPVLDIRENYYIAKEENLLIEEDVKYIDLKISYKEIVAKIIKKIFIVFNADDIPDSVISEWQDKIISRKL